MKPIDQIVLRIRAACAAEFNKPINYPFFESNLRDGETIDDMLLRLFEAEQRASGANADAVIDALVHG